MPLTADPSGRFEQAKPEAILFVMFNGNDRIACRVDWAALQDRAMADGTEGNDIAETFKRHRHTIERIASDQFDAGRQMPVVRSEHLTP
ncbi:DUF1488 family protein [Bradyrhizobium sp. U531]|uniref:DUF1488 family protein n=1 Tax=Bradyrhizobium sp. U531 TaxID=3053458 RepID=UPI003F420C18